MTRTVWTWTERCEFEANHERVIAQYPESVQRELRNDRKKWLANVPLKNRGKNYGEALK